MDTMDRKNLLQLAETIVAGKEPHEAAYRSLAAIPETYWLALLAGADLIRDRFFGKQIHLCSICSAKSG